jgi:hypothetical protein
MHVLRVPALLALVHQFPCLELCDAMCHNSCKLDMLWGFCSPLHCHNRNALHKVFMHLANAHILFGSTGTRRLVLLTGIILCHLCLFLAYLTLSLPSLGGSVLGFLHMCVWLQLKCPWFPSDACLVCLSVLGSLPAWLLQCQKAVQ